MTSQGIVFYFKEKSGKIFVGLVNPGGTWGILKGTRRSWIGMKEAAEEVLDVDWRKVPKYKQTPMTIIGGIRVYLADVGASGSDARVFLENAGVDFIYTWAGDERVDEESRWILGMVSEYM